MTKHQITLCFTYLFSILLMAQFPNKITILFSPLIMFLLIVYLYKDKIYTYDLNKIKSKQVWLLIYKSILAGLILQGLGNFTNQYIFHIPAPDTKFAYVLTASSVTAVVLSAVVEEVIFRGIIFKSLSNKIDPFYAAMISSFLFAICHYNQAAWSGYFLVGLVWCYFYRKSNNVAVPVVSHMIINYLMMLSYSIQFN